VKRYEFVAVYLLCILFGVSNARVKQLVMPTDMESFPDGMYDSNISVPKVKVMPMRGGKYKLTFEKVKNIQYYCSFDGDSPTPDSRQCPDVTTIMGTKVIKMVGIANGKSVSRTRVVLVYDSIEKKIDGGPSVLKIPTIAGVLSITQFQDVADVVLNGRLVARHEGYGSIYYLESSNLLGGEWQLIALGPNMWGNACNSSGVYVYALNKDKVLNLSYIPSCGSVDVHASALNDGSLRIVMPAYTAMNGHRYPEDVFLCDGENISLLSGLKEDLKSVIASDSIYKQDDIDKADSTGETKYLALDTSEDASEESVIDAILAGGGGSLKKRSKGGHGASGDSDRMGGMGGTGFGTLGRAGWGTGNGGTRKGKTALGAGGTGKGTARHSNADSAKMSSVKPDTEAGSRSPESILRIIRAHTGGFQYTFQKYLKLNPSIGGKLSLKFTISAPGDIIAISVASSNTGSAELDDEIKDKARRMKFDPIEKGNVTVTYAIVLNKD